MINVVCTAELEEARLENRRLLSVIDRLRETELSLRSQVDKVCGASVHVTGVGGASVHVTGVTEASVYMLQGWVGLVYILQGGWG